MTFKWHFGAEEYAEVQMRVGTSPGWRTWSSANLRPGGWRVELVDANGVVLMERRFTVSGIAAAHSFVIDPDPDRKIPRQKEEAHMADGISMELP